MSVTAAGLEQHELAAYWAAVESADERAALALATSARDRGVPLEDVLQQLVVAAQLRVGVLWAHKIWTVARAHAAPGVGVVVVRGLAAHLPEADTGPKLIVACVEREWHALPALVVATTLRSRGRRVEFLGASASRDQLISRILDVGPRAVLLSASLTSSLPRVRRQIEAVRGTGTPVVVGGRAFDPAGLRAQRLGATAYGATPQAALDLLTTLPAHVPSAPGLRHLGAAEARAILSESDTVARDVIASTDVVLGVSGGAALSPDDWRVVLANFVPHVVDSLAGSLLTEDPRVMAEIRGWLGDVLDRRGADPAALPALDEALALRLRDYPETIRMLGAAVSPG